MRFGSFFLGLLVVVTLVNLYVHRRASRTFALSVRHRRLLGVAMVLGALAMVASRVIGGVWMGAPVVGLGVFGSAVEIAVIVAAFLLGIADLVGLAFRGTERLANRLHGAPAAAAAPVVVEPSSASEPPASEPVPEPPAAQTTRREALSRIVAGSAIAAGAATAGYGAIFGRRDYTIEEVVVKIPGLPRTLEGYTLVQLSDVHFGQYVGEAEIAAASSLVKDARPDMVVLTGDLVDHDIRYAPLLGAFARRLEQHARDGVISVPGNHDHYAGVAQVNEVLRAAGTRVLMNEGMVIGEPKAGLALLGVDDMWGARRSRGAGPDLDKAIATVPADLPRVLLCHNPAFFPEAAGRIALQLSGHTHGGQVNFLVRPADMVLPFGYVAGRYDREGSELWVNRGFGTAGPPLRVGSPPEVTRVVLVAA